MSRPASPAPAVVVRPPPLRLKVDNPKPLDFVNASTQWADWLKRFARFRNVTGLSEQPEDVQIDALLMIMGPESEEVLSQLTFEEGEDKKYDGVVAAFTLYFQPRRNILNYRTQFYNRKQLSDELAEEYIRCIHNLAVKCKFSEGLTQADMIKDRLLSGMVDTILSSELQLDEDVSLDTVTSKMRAKETIYKQMTSESMVAAVKSTARQVSSRKQSSTDKTIRDCKYCGGSHKHRACPAYGKTCNRCSKPNHFERVCKLSKAPQANEVTVDQPAEDSDFYIASLEYKVDAISIDTKTIYAEEFSVEPYLNVMNVNNEWFLDFNVHGNIMNAKIDTGAQTNVISCTELNRVSPHAIIKPTNTRLTAYSGHVLPVLGVSEVELAFEGERHSLAFHVLGDGRKAQTLIGLPSIKRMGILNVSAVGCVGSKHSEVQGKCSLADEFGDVFTGFGKLKTSHSITLKPDATPFVCPPRSVPHAIREKLKSELDRLESLEIITLCQGPSEWLNQIVTVVKPDGSLRICLDPQQLNAVTIRERYTLPTISDIYARLSGSTVFTTLDAQSGFHQIPLDEKSSNLTTFLTPFGRYKYLRLPFGLTSAPEFFHKTMIDLVGDVPGVEVYIDDVLIHARTQSEHDARLRDVLLKFREAGLKLNAKKCQFNAKSVKFLGNLLSKEGISPSPDKVLAIRNVQTPSNKSEVRSFLGMVTYLSKFCQNLSQHTKPLRDLLKENVEFCWESMHAEAFEIVKNLVTNAPVLALFDPTKKVVVNVDASSHSLGAVLFQNGQPVEFAAQSLTPTQCIYAQVEKEMLAIQFGLTRFHQYVYGQEVSVESDHQPLVRLCKKPLSGLTPRLQRMRMQIQHYSYTVVHVPGKQMYVSDYLSRSCKEKTYEVDLGGDDPMPHICSIRVRDETSLDEYQEATGKDTSLQVVKQYVLSGWPVQKRLCHALAKSYWKFKHEISEYNGLLFYGDRVIVPHQKQSHVIDQLHASHQGITKTQQRARTAVFWPGMNHRIEDKISSCSICKTHDKAQNHEPLIPSEVPDYPWQILGSDLFQFKGKQFLLNVDYFSKWVNVVELSDLSSQAIVKEFRKQIADFGCPATIRSDNGPQYFSKEFREFCRVNDILHVTSSPGYARSNGQVERSIQTVKRLMLKASEDGSCFWKALQMFRNTPLDNAIPSPAQLLQGRTLYDGIPVRQHCLFPRAYNRVRVKEWFVTRQSKMKDNHDVKATFEKQVLVEGQNVRFKTQKGRWEKAVVQSHHENSRSYNIKNLETGIVIRRNRHQVRPDYTSESSIVSPLDRSSQRAEHTKVGHSLSAETDVNPSHDSAIASPMPKEEPVCASPDLSPSAAPATPCINVQTPVRKTKTGRVIVRPIRFRDN